MTAFGGALTDPTKIMGSRIGAYLVDAVITTAIVLGYFFLIGIHSWNQVPASDASAVCSQINRDTTSSPGVARSSRTCLSLGGHAYVADADQFDRTRVETTVVGLVVSFANLVLLTAASGASIGKRLFGLRVVDASGQIAGFGRNLLRWVLLIVDALCCGIVGLVVASNSAGHRRVGDMAAGTYVVHRSAAGHLLSIPGHLVVRRHDQYGGWGPEPAPEVPTLGQGGGLDAPVWDAARNAYVRYDQASGLWFQWDEAAQSWVPARG